MLFDLVLGAIVALLILIYLISALARPEHF
jgi:K+-transporting ATPase KdpF subunit